MKASSKEKDESAKANLYSYANRLYVTGRNQWAGWMEAKASKLSRKQHYVFLGMFTLFTGACLLYQIYRGLSGDKTYIFQPEKIEFVTTGPLTESGQSYTTDQSFTKIKEFRSYMDSLSNTASGRKARDSILRARPGLLDSVASLESYYRFKLKN